MFRKRPGSFFVGSRFLCHELDMNVFSVFLGFFGQRKTLAPAVLSSCLFINTTVDREKEGGFKIRVSV